MNFDKQFIKSIEMDLVEATTEQEFSINDAREYMTKHFVKHGLENYHISESKYNKIRAEYNQSKQNNPQAIFNYSKDNQMLHTRAKDVRHIDELIMAYLTEARTHILRAERPFVALRLLDPDKEEWLKDYKRMDKSTEIIIKLINTKYQILNLRPKTHD